MRRNIPAGALSLSMAGVAWGGWLDDAIKNAGENLGRRTVNDSASGVYDGAKDAVKGGDNPSGKQPAGNQPSAGDPDGSRSAPASNRTGAGGASAGSDVGSGDASIEQAEAGYSKYDFTPGDKVIFCDDFRRVEFVKF